MLDGKRVCFVFNTTQKIKLKSPFYLNIRENRNGEFYPVWDDEYVGSDSRNKAIRLRKAFIERFQLTDTFKTVRIEEAVILRG